MVKGRCIGKYCFDNSSAADYLICVKFCLMSQNTAKIKAN